MRSRLWLALAIQKLMVDLLRVERLSAVEDRFCDDEFGATEVIERFKALPASERAQVARFVVENDDSWIPESFKQGMADAEAG